MKQLRLALVLCGAAGLAPMPYAAQAFEIQNEGDKLSANGAEFTGLEQNYLSQEFKGHSLAMPYTSKNEDLGHVSDYGNSIPIPGPGISLPSPAWAYTPAFR